MTQPAALGFDSASPRARVVSIVGILLVPAVAYKVPYVSPYAAVVLGAALAAFMVWIKPSSPLRELGLSRPSNVTRTLLLGLAIGIGLLLISRLVLTPVIEQVTGVRRDLSSFDYLRGNSRAVIVLLPSVWISAGICEEVVYRGYLISQVVLLFGNSRTARLAAVIFAAVLFALAHWYQGPTGMLLTGALATVFGLLFLRQGRNLWCNMVAHITGDTASLILIALSWDRWRIPG